MKGMVLVIDFDNSGQDILLADEGTVRRFSSLSGEGFRGLDDVLEVMSGEGLDRAEGVAVILPQESGKRRGERGERNMSWSTVRAAVALGNALAFAWDVPAVRIEDSRQEAGEGEDGRDAALRDEATRALREAAPDARVSATYDGEPNITKPKP